MAFALLIVGLMLTTVAVRGTDQQFVQLVKNDFSGPGNFWYWVVSLLVIGMLGNVKALKPLADSLLILILVALILTRGSPSFPGGGVFQQFTNALKTTTTANPVNTIAGIPGFGPIVNA
jgi:hypothetical protein